MKTSLARLGRDIAGGAAAGSGATAAMSVLMLTWQRSSSGPSLAPAVVTDRALEAVHLRPSSTSLRAAVEAVAHFGFGSGAGAAYGLLSDGLRRVVPAVQRVPAPLRGAVFGLGVWAVSYGAAIPALGLLPPPADDRPGRQGRLVAAHLVYGATLATLRGDDPS